MKIQDKIVWTVVGCVALVVAVLFALVPNRYDGYMQVVFLDVGQGSGAYLRTPAGYELLVDAGATKQTLRALTPYRRFWDRHFDYFVATHPDLDHIGAFPALLDRFDVGAFVASNKSSDAGAYRSLVQQLQDREIPTIYPTAGQTIVLDDGVQIEILFPDGTKLDRVGANTAGLVLRVVYGDTAFLITGDVPKRIERYLMDQQPERVLADVLAVGHHGSKTSTDADFVAAVAPDHAIISAGRDNRHGHPDAEVLETLAAYGQATVWRTDLQGSVGFWSDGVGVYVMD